jgi:hypothetical protein
MTKTRVTADELIWILGEELKGRKECPAAVMIAVVPDRVAGWAVIIGKTQRRSHPGCVKTIRAMEKRLIEKYTLIS